MSSYAPGSGQYFGEPHGHEGDKETIQAGGESQGLDVQGEV